MSSSPSTAETSARSGHGSPLDFAAALAAIARSLETATEETFELTESDARLRFARDGDEVRVISNYADALEASTSLDALQSATAAFLDRVLEDLTTAHPELAANPNLAALRDPG